MFKKLALATALLAGLSTAHAYQAEINGALMKILILMRRLILIQFFVNGKYYLKCGSSAKMHH